MSSKFEKLAMSLDTTQEQFFELIDKDYEYCMLIVKNTSANIMVLRKIYDVLKEVLSPLSAASKVLSNPNVDDALISEIINNSPELEPEGDVDYPENTCYPVLLAKHTKTPIESIVKLAQSPWYMVREKVAGRDDLTQEVMDILVRDNICHVRHILAANPYVSSSILDLLANDKDPTTRLKVVLNPNVSIQTIKLLSKDVNEIVCLAALSSQHFI
jgi:hypothetical protein